MKPSAPCTLPYFSAIGYISATVGNFHYNSPEKQLTIGRSIDRDGDSMACTFRRLSLDLERTGHGSLCFTT